MSTRTTWIVALALIAVGAVALVFLQDPAFRLFGSEQAALYTGLLGAALMGAGLALAAVAVLKGRKPRA